MYLDRQVRIHPKPGKHCICPSHSNLCLNLNYWPAQTHYKQAYSHSQHSGSTVVTASHSSIHLWAPKHAHDTRIQPGLNWQPSRCSIFVAFYDCLIQYPVAAQESQERG